nr:FHA domain-containing protein [uncultured Desulfobacter sp.]
MSMKRCENGHYYDSEKHSTCPYCGVSDVEIGKTRPQKEEFSALDGLAGQQEERRTHRPGQPPMRPNDEAHTVGFFRKKTGIDPVVGWLICTEGPDRGRDYRIRSEKNFIGRSQSMNICIQNDESVSRDNHASVSYNPKKKSFKIHPGTSRGLVYLNDEDVDMPTELSAYDVIELGQTKLIFIPFCGEKFQWENDTKVE